MGTYTPLKNYYKPATGEAGWGPLVNATFDALDNEPDWGGILKVHVSGGISLTNGAHVDPGANVFDIFYQITTGDILTDGLTVGANGLTINGDFNANGTIELDGNLEHSDPSGWAAEFIDGITIKVSGANVSNPPTISELEAAFDISAATQEGFIGILDDNYLDTNVYLVIVSDTPTYHYLKFTKAVA